MTRVLAASSATAVVFSSRGVPPGLCIDAKEPAPSRSSVKVVVDSDSSSAVGSSTRWPEMTQNEVEYSGRESTRGMACSCSSTRRTPPPASSSFATGRRTSWSAHSIASIAASSTLPSCSSTYKSQRQHHTARPCSMQSASRFTSVPDAVRCSSSSIAACSRSKRLVAAPPREANCAAIELVAAISSETTIQPRRPSLSSGTTGSACTPASTSVCPRRTIAEPSAEVAARALTKALRPRRSARPSGRTP
mmetsp:Transcript_56200/g.129038  ORF Transcript_56200/g.129038 Transcript_56200/m.129038 type:complete len:249 (-) Transcript_56200:7-753(-)